MTVRSVSPPYPIFFDTNGKALDDGDVYIGEANLDPTTNPLTAYWDQDLTTAASQPVETTNGYLSNSGSPGNLYLNSDYSISVYNKNGELVYTKASQEIPGEDQSFSVTGATGGTNVKTITLADNSGAVIEVYGAGLKGALLAASRAMFSIWRLTGTMQITRIDSEEMRDGGDLDAYFDMVQSGNDGIIKAYTVSGSWSVTGNVRSISGGAVTFS